MKRVQFILAWRRVFAAGALALLFFRPCVVGHAGGSAIGDTTSATSGHHQPAQFLQAPSADTIVEFRLPTANSQPSGITAGPDGNIWICETSANKITKMTPDGSSFTEYPLAANSGPVVITAGPDNNLWFTEGAANEIGKNAASPKSRVIVPKYFEPILLEPAKKYRRVVSWVAQY